jgi:hypothetical protein
MVPTTRKGPNPTKINNKKNIFTLSCNNLRKNAGPINQKE